MPNKRILVGFAVVLLMSGILAWAYFESTKPLPGVLGLQESREHRPQGEKIDYQQNPPTSGPHYPEPAKPGVYDQPVADGYLVHSMEHGYIIIWYNCDRLNALNFISTVYAHGTEAEHATESANLASDSAKLSEKFNSQACSDLKSKLKAIYDKKGPYKLIIVPRPNLDSTIALTAWGRFDKFDSFDEQRINNFIDKLRDHGPEKTMQ